jgi:hypothetical protein
MVGLDADRLMALLDRLVAACERIADLSEAARPGGRKRRRGSPGAPVEVEPVAVHEVEGGSPGNPQLPAEVGTARAAEILGVSKDTVLEYKRKGLLPFRDLAPPGSTKPIYMYPLDAVVRLRTTYQTEEQADNVPRDPPRRRVKGRREFKHLILDEEA